MPKLFVRPTYRVTNYILFAVPINLMAIIDPHLTFWSLPPPSRRRRGRPALTQSRDLNSSNKPPVENRSGFAYTVNALQDDTMPQ